MIYTSRYQNPELATGHYTVVGVTRGKPKFPLKYPLAGNIMEIAPPGYLFNEYDRGRFTPRYFQHMDRQGVDKIVRILAGYERLGKDVVLCCFEDVRKPNEWCHRLVVQADGRGHPGTAGPQPGSWREESAGADFPDTHAGPD